MRAFEAKENSARYDAAAPAPEELRIAVSFRSRQDGIGLTKLAARVSSASVARVAPDPLDVDRAVEELRRRGFVVSGRGALSLSVRGSRALFEKTFGTVLSEVRLDAKQAYSTHKVFYPAAGAPWSPDPQLAQVIDDAYIQWPHIYMGAARGKLAPAAAAARKPPKGAQPPKVPYFHLDVLKDVPRLLNVDPIRRQGGRGKGVRIAMIDTGFAHGHPFFRKHRFGSTVVLAPGAINRRTDPGSHGTGESANVFAIAPAATFIGVKLENDDDPQGGASILEGLQKALEHAPHVISVSMGYDLRAADGRRPLQALPSGVKALEAEIQAAVARGITVVFSAGNGHYAFPGQMPEVLSAGGTFVDRQGAMRASDYASAFRSEIYSGRSVPDFCGLVGLRPHADYIMLPVPPGAEIDADNASHDGTRPDDGWAVFSGTSAAAPQIAAVCALLLEKNPGLTPADIQAVLGRTARDVTAGRANPASDPAGQGVPAGLGMDGATGSGLIDAFAAWSQV
jgi:subtilisin family serine protease